MFLDRSSVSSYLAFLFQGGIAGAVKDNVEETSIKVTSTLAKRTIEEAPWLYDLFPELVNKGMVVMKDGHIFVYGMSFMDICSIIAISLTLIFTAGKFIMDYITFRNNRKK